MFGAGFACPDMETQAGIVVKDLADEILAETSKKFSFFRSGGNIVS